MHVSLYYLTTNILSKENLTNNIKKSSKKLIYNIEEIL